VTVGAREGPSRVRAREAGFLVLSPVEVVQRADVIALLVPERSHGEVLREVINPHALPNASLVFAHGYTKVFGEEVIREDLQCLLVAPKAIGPELRRLYERGQGAPALVSAEPGDLELAKAYAKALGCGRAGIIPSSFREETETDLFGEQAVLCGGLPALIRSAFETLVEAGYAPEVALYECVIEVKLIADMIYERGVAGMFSRISDTAQIGAMTSGKVVVNESVREGMRRILHDIQSGRFAKRVSAEREGGYRDLEGWLQEWQSSLLEQVFARVRLSESSS
ncbi:MAG: ketol-acid reductoisomerase, partial [Fimbriimonadales bacterium]|nr:ketol-acid reductoisomerase [Fimbriimonadales bacterium]